MRDGPQPLLGPTGIVARTSARVGRGVVPPLSLTVPATLSPRIRSPAPPPTGTRPSCSALSDHRRVDLEPRRSDGQIRQTIRQVQRTACGHRSGWRVDVRAAINAALSADVCSPGEGAKSHRPHRSDPSAPAHKLPRAAHSWRVDASRPVRSLIEGFRNGRDGDPLRSRSGSNSRRPAGAVVQEALKGCAGA